MTRPVACLEGAHEQASPGPRRSHKFQLVSDSRPAGQSQVSGSLAMRGQSGVSSYAGQRTTQTLNGCGHAAGKRLK